MNVLIALLDLVRHQIGKMVTVERCNGNIDKAESLQEIECNLILAVDVLTNMRLDDAS